MPEGVEVKLQIEKLNKLKNQPIQSIHILSGRYTRHGPPIGFKQFQKNLPLTIEHINHKGKFIYFTLTNGWYILITLGMTGKLILQSNPPKTQKHNHIELNFPNQTLFFNDLRNFGTIQFTNNNETLIHKLDKLGFDPLQENITPAQFLAHIGKFHPNKKIGELLLDQRFISGVGNYLRADILYCAKIHPESEIGNIPPNILKKLLECISKTMHSSYQKQKTKKEFKFIIYKQPLSPINNPTEKYKDKYGRTIWYVPDEQVLF